VPTITLYLSLWKLIRSIIAGVLLTSGCVVALLFADPSKLSSPYDHYWPLIYPLTLLFAAGTVYWVVRLVRRRPAFQITPEGIIDTSSAAGVGLVRWENITRVGLKTTTSYVVNRSFYLTITPHDMKAALAHNASLLAKLYDGFGKDIDIGQVGLPLTVRKLLTQIETYYQTYIAASQPSAIIFDHVVQTEKKS
jgi:hypothetical protein